MTVRTYHPAISLTTTCPQTEENGHPASFRSDVWSVCPITQLFLDSKPVTATTKRKLPKFLTVLSRLKPIPVWKIPLPPGIEQVPHPLYKFKTARLKLRDYWARTLADITQFVLNNYLIRLVDSEFIFFKYFKYLVLSLLLPNCNFFIIIIIIIIIIVIIKYAAY